MPTYTVTNKDGVTLKITGEQPPTKEQLDNIFSEYNEQKIQTAPVQETLPQQVKLTEEVVKKDPKWIEASKSIYKWNEGIDAPDLETDQDYAEYGLDYMGRFNYNLPQMTVEANQLKDATDKQKQDFITLMDMYDKKSASWSGAGRLLKGLATDPTTYVGLGTLGVGTAGAQAVKQAIKEGVKQGTKAGLKQGAKIGSMEGAVYATADNALRQTARINAGVQEDFDLGESAKAATVGATAGAGLGGVIGGIGTNIAARSKLNQIAQREESTLQKENVDVEQIEKETQPIVQKEITREAEQTIKPSTQQEAPLTQKLQEIAEPIPDTEVSSEEIASGLLGKNYQKVATQTIDFLKRPFIKYKPLKTLPDQDRYLTLRGLATGKLQKVRDVTRDVYDTFARLSPEDNFAVRQYLTKKANLKSIQNPIIRSQAKELRESIDFVGESLVKANILSKDVVDANKESYLPKMYLKYLDKKGRMDYTKSRKDLDDATVEFLGEVKDISLQGSKAIEDPMSDIVKYSLFEKITEDPKWTIQSGLIDFQGKNVSPVWMAEERDRIANEIVKKIRPKEDKKIVESMDALIDQANLNIKKSDLRLYKQVPDAKQYGSLRGSYIRKEIYDDLISAGDFINPKDNFAKSVLGDSGTITQATKLWKMSKVALNPPSQVRNGISNVILLNLSGIPLRKIPTRLSQALNDMRQNGPYTDIAKKYGILDSTFSRQEMIDINKAYLKAKAKETGNIVDRIKYIGGAISEIGTNAYQKMEIVGKTAKIIDEMSKGADEATAALRAQETLFDYSLVPPSVRYLRNAPVGIPFLTYYYKVLPNLLETAIRYPERYVPYLAIPYGMHEIVKQYQGITSEDIKTIKQSMPEWIRDNGNALILPIKDENDKWQVLDFSYFLPYAMFTGMAKDVKELELQEALSKSGVFGGPLPQTISAIQTNIDPFTKREIVNEYDPESKQLADMMLYAYRMAAPTWLTDIGFAGKLLQSINKDVNKFGDPKVTKTQAILRLVGTNIYPIDPEQSRATNIKFMRNEISRIKARRTKVLKDKNLTPEERKRLQEKYLEILQDRQEQLKDYIKESKITEGLK
jgi:hypothetical protein